MDERISNTIILFIIWIVAIYAAFMQYTDASLVLAAWYSVEFVKIRLTKKEDKNG